MIVGRFGVAAAALALLLLSHSSQAADDDAVKRGEYLYHAADCVACHTDIKNQGKPLAGGRPMETPFGTYYGPNITFDPQHGIGKWTEAQFVSALRTGIGPDGQVRVADGPFTSFTGMVEEVDEEKGRYLKAQPAVAQPSKPHEVHFPYNIRFSLVGWRLLFFSQGPIKPDPAKGAEWNRGNYLVNAVDHCGECHTPRNWMGAMDQSKAFAGVKNGPDGQSAPNITPDPNKGIGKWTIEEIMDLLESGQTPEMDFVGSGMAEVVKGTAKLSAEDRRAMAVYLKSLKPIGG